MQFGVCGDLNLCTSAAKASYDYAEWSVTALLKPLQPEDAFHAALETTRRAELPYPVLNIFIPGELKITGPDVNIPALESYVKTTMTRAEIAGVKIIVFGSGGARRIPDGFSPATAHDQLVSFCRMVGPIASDHGVTVAVEPLNKADCNVLNTVSECANLVNETAHPAIRLLVDSYHLMRDNDSFDSIITHGSLLAHAHIATVPTRLAPAAEDCDLSEFFSALRKANYSGRISIEAKIANPEIDLPAALALMRKLSDPKH